VVPACGVVVDPHLEECHDIYNQHEVNCLNGSGGNGTGCPGFVEED
jgi:hypothetical protein